MGARRTVLCVYWLCAVACAGSGNLLVDPSERTLVLVSGRTGQPVVGAAVSLGGATYRSDALGRVRLAADARGDLDVAAEDFLLRQTSLAHALTVSLWPTGPDYPADYVRHLLYKPSYQTREGSSPAPDEPLRRVVASLVTVVPEPALWVDPDVVHAHQRAVEEINRATEGLVRFELGHGAIPGVVFRAYLDASLPAGGALTYRDLRENAIVGGRIAYSELAAARSPHFVAHELGHALGLQHSTVPSDMMYYAARTDAAGLFTDKERLSIRLLLQRKPGNRYPDNDRGSAGAGSSSAGSASETSSIAVN